MRQRIMRLFGIRPRKRPPTIHVTIGADASEFQAKLKRLREQIDRLG